MGNGELAMARDAFSRCRDTPSRNRSNRTVRRTNRATEISISNGIYLAW